MDNVVVVGAGPTGLTLACELAARGVAVEVVERAEVPSGQSRGGGVNARTAEMLHMRGMLDAVTARAVPREGAGGHFAGLPVVLDRTPWRSRFPDGVLIRQDRLEAVLEQHARHLGVAVRRGATLTGLTTGSDGVTATVSGPAGAAQLQARFLVACDGGHSTVRKLVGAAFPGRTGTMSAVTGDIALGEVADSVPRAVGHISMLMRTAGGYFMMLHPIGDADDHTGRYRIVFGGPEQATLPREAPVTAGEITRALDAVHPGTTLAQLYGATRFSDATRQVEQYRHGAVLFAGDAAHIHPPVGGQGLNLGVQDAMNLGWKLAAHLSGRAPAGLLDSYHDERHPVGERVIATARAQSVLVAAAPDDLNVLALREIVADMARLPDTNRYLSGLMAGFDIRYPESGQDDPLLGTRMIDLALDAGEGPTTVAALLRAGRGLLLELGAPGSGPTPVAAGLDRVVARVLASPIGTDLGAGPGVDRVLVRPDGYVAWVGAGPAASPAAAIRRWFGEPVTVPA
ncbi:FAD-dependent oxidoreductase [Pseudonocardia sp. GCM10023141]|uniref:FAD-dependent oxidoreductase n=1 Tax=Pseudonocardia sp. GCM10023141 TaxID=3252653 RepID=UPI003608A5FC